MYSFPLAGEGAPLSWCPSAVADAGNGGTLNCAPSADAIVGSGWDGGEEVREREQ